jgi:hypothetical protein
MRRAALIALLSLVIVALVGAPIAAHGRRHPHHPPTPFVAAAAGKARQGGTLVVRAAVFVPWRLARQGAEVSATAVVHFASGDVTVELVAPARHRGHGLHALPWWPVPVWTGVARVEVGATEQPGRVRVDVEALVNGVAYPAVAFGRVRGTPQPPPEDDPGPLPCTAGCEEL